MANLNTHFFGLNLKSPIIVGSSGLTNSVEKIKKLEAYGAGAVILKSIFEEEIYLEYEHEMKEQFQGHHSMEHLDYFDYQIKEKNIETYINLIQSAKKETSIPIVASINCQTSTDWVFFAEKLEEAGADALELNLFVLPSDSTKSDEDIKKIYFQTINNVLRTVSIPVSIKISPYFSDLLKTVSDLSKLNIAGITLFNRFYNIDIDIDTKELVPAMVLSHPYEYLQSLRWIGIMSGRVECELAASTGVHTTESAIKQMLAGANAVQVVSAIYKKGYEFVKEMVDGLDKWMDENNYETIPEIIGLANKLRTKNPSLYMRVQFMKNFGEFGQ